MHQLTATDIARIQDAAKRIGPIRRIVQRTMSGAQLIDLGYENWQGRPINPTAQYAMNVMKEANLALVIINICRRDGMDRFHAAMRDMYNQRPKLLPNGSLHIPSNSTNHINP